jgi:hypothetical protein
MQVKTISGDSHPKDIKLHGTTVGVIVSWEQGATARSIG